MNSKKYRLALIIEIILFLILITVVYLNPFWKSTTPLQIDSIHPNEFYIATSLLFFVVPLSFLFASGITRLYKPKSVANESVTPILEKNSKQSLFWKYSFYSSFYFSFGFLIFSIFTRFTSEHPVLIYKTDSFLLNFVIFSLGILLLSFFIGALFLGTTVLRKNNKASAFVLTIVIVLFFISPFFAVSKYHQYCENMKPGIAVDSLSEDFTFFEEETEEGYEEEEASFSDLWDNASNDEKNVVTALEYFFIELLFYINPAPEQEDRGNTKKMYSYMTENLPESTSIDHLITFANTNAIEDYDEDNFEGMENDESFYLASIISKIKQHPDIVNEYFDKYKHLLYALIDEKIYKQASFDRAVKLLLTTHNDLKSSGISEEEKEKLYRKFAFNESLNPHDSDYDGPETQLDKMKAFYSEASMEKIRGILEQDTYEFGQFYNVTFWAYSFWIRRHHDENEELVYNILTEIDEHYNSAND